MKPDTLSVNGFPRFMGSQVPGQLVFIILATGALLAAALLSWHLYEKQFLKLKELFPYHTMGTEAAISPPGAAHRAHTVGSSGI